MINSTPNQLNFNGKFQGLIIGKTTHQLPRNPMKGCCYSDRLMMRVVRKTLNSKKYSKDLSIKLENTSEGKNLVCEMERSSIRRFIPAPIKILGGRMFNLPNPVFWKILGTKKINKIRYQLPQKDFEGAIDYFTKQRTPTERMEGFKGEDPRIIKKAEKFRNTLTKHLKGKLEDKWFREYFEKINPQPAKQKEKIIPLNSKPDILKNYG